jgi:hypothetical protein
MSDEPPKGFIAWWAAHPHRKHGPPARIAYKCQCYIEEYEAAAVLEPLLKTAEPEAGARQKVVHRSAVH